MRSLYSEEVPQILNIIDQGIRTRVESVGPDETVGVLEFIRDKISAHNGEYIRIPKIPFDISKVDRSFLEELFKTGDTQNSLFQQLMTQNWSNRFTDLIKDDAGE